MRRYTANDYVRFFPKLIAEVAKERPDLAGHYSSRENYCTFTRVGKYAKIYYSVAFRPSDSQIEAELFITTGDRGRNLVHFVDDLRQHRQELRKEFGAALNEDMYGKQNMEACRIGIRTADTPAVPDAELQTLRRWSIDMLAVLEKQFGHWIDDTYPPKDRSGR